MREPGAWWFVWRGRASPEMGRAWVSARETGRWRSRQAPPEMGSRGCRGAARCGQERGVLRWWARAGARGSLVALVVVALVVGAPRCCRSRYSLPARCRRRLRGGGLESVALRAVATAGDGVARVVQSRGCVEEGCCARAGARSGGVLLLIFFFFWFKLPLYVIIHYNGTTK
jgi:hypothetical protein